MRRRRRGGWKREKGERNRRKRVEGRRGHRGRRNKFKRKYFSAGRLVKIPVYIYMYLFTNKGPGDLIAIEFIPTGQAVPARGYTRHTENFTLFHLTGREEGRKKLRSFPPTLSLIAAYLTLFTR